MGNGEERKAEAQEERRVPEGRKGSSTDRGCIPMSLNVLLPFFVLDKLQSLLSTALPY